MRSPGFLIATALMVLTFAPLNAAVFGNVVPIIGQPADIVLDEPRGLLYIANFTTNRIDVMSTADNTVHTSMSAAGLAGGLALSPDGRYLVVTNYGSWTGIPPVAANLVAVIDLVSNTRQTFTTGDAPLAVAFITSDNSRRSGLAMIATTTGFLLLDPATGSIQSIASLANLSLSLPTSQGTFPPQILKASMTTAANGRHVWGMVEAANGGQMIFLYDGNTGSMTAQVWVTSPKLLPRVSAAADGSYAMIGWAVFMRAQCGGGFMIRSRYPTATDSINVTGHAIDSKNGIIYAQIPDSTSQSNPTSPAGSASSAKLPAFSILEADNLTRRDRIYLPENMTGRAVLNSTNSMMYAISESGVMVLPVGSMNRVNRLAVSAEDMLVQSNFCNRNAMKQTFVVSDPGGNRTNFSISSSQSGVFISPSSGTTPATITVTVEATAMQNTFGTLGVPLQIRSSNAVNAPPSVRLLISNPDQDQRGTVVNVPGLLTDILADTEAIRNQFFVVRQDKNQILTFNGGSTTPKAVLRTPTTPMRVSLTNDRKSLVVASKDSQLLQVYDLDTLQPQSAVMLPPSHYGMSIAESNNAMFVVVENDETRKGNLDRVNLQTGCAFTPKSLGTWVNDMPATSVVTPTNGQKSILLAETDGNVKLYDAELDTWILSRKDFDKFEGGYAASDPNGPPTASLPDDPSDIGIYVVGNQILNPALYPIGAMDSSVGNTMGFAFTGATQSGFRVTGNAASGPGVIQNMAALRVAPVTNTRPVRVTEAPVLSTVDLPMTRTVAPMPGVNAVHVLTTSGFTVLSGNYDQAVAPPSITGIVNAADGGKPVAPGGLISIYGKNLSPTNVATSQMPLPTALGQSCLVANGMLVPLLFVSSSQINAQLPAKATGYTNMTIHTPGGVSDTFGFSASGTAPSVFTSGSVGPLTGLATVVRADNNQLVTPTNPVHPNDSIVVYLTGLGATSPAVDDGMPAPSEPLATAVVTPSLSLGGTALNVQYAGLVPGYVGVYQINATVPYGVSQGMEVPLVIDQGGNSTALNVRVVK